jgi:hypothetical protein
VLTEADLGLFIAGVPELDVADWRRNTSLEGFQADSPAVSWFWSAVSAMSAEDRGLLMRFATGSSAAPLGGFKNLSTIASEVLLYLSRYEKRLHSAAGRRNNLICSNAQPVLNMQERRSGEVSVT